MSADEAVEVTIRDFSYGPPDITVGLGGTVTWRNDGPSAHSATAQDNRFNTGLLKPGESADATFNETGTFSYLCTVHPQMKGTVNVVSVSEPAQPAQEEPADADDAQAEEAPETAHPRTGAALGLRMLIGVAFVVVGANGYFLMSRPRYR